MNLETAQSRKLPRFTLGLIFTGTLLVVLVLAGLLWPQYNRMTQSGKKRTTAALELERQKALFPIFARAKVIADTPFVPQLPTPERNPLERKAIIRLSEIFTEIAWSHNMIVSENSIDLSALNDESATISTEIQLDGNLFDFRSCLVEISALPFLNHIETLTIASDPEGIKKFKTKLLINIKKN